MMHDMKIIISSLELSPVPQNNRVLPCVCVPKKSSLPQNYHHDNLVFPKQSIYSSVSQSNNMCPKIIMSSLKLSIILCSPNKITAPQNLHLFPTYSPGPQNNR